jgi:transposase
VDGSGLPRRIVLTAGQAHDGSAVPQLLGNLPPNSDVIADRGYDTNAILTLIRQTGSRAHIPTPCRRLIQRSVDPVIYRQRNLIERFFNKLKHFRRIATRFDKSARNFLAAVLLASTRLWMRTL